MLKKNAIINISLVLIFLAFLPFIRSSNSAAAFHEGGVGPCEACHTMHGEGQTQSNMYLLKGLNQSSICLNCHERAGDSAPTGAHISTTGVDIPQGLPPKQLTPGGDFGWLKKTFTWSPSSGQALSYSMGERHGHNIIAPDYAYTLDTTNAEAPGGAYPATSLTCISCHDPHGSYRRHQDGSISKSGKPIRASGSSASSPNPDSMFDVGVYRLLGGKGYQPKSLFGNYAFINDPPASVAPDVYNRSEAVSQTRVAYGSGMSEWCQNCHKIMHTVLFPGRANLMHPSGDGNRLGATKANYYNTYVKTGDLSGIQTSSYLSLVPFEQGTTDYLRLKTVAKNDNSNLLGPDGTNSQVMCLTCHRAHASGWDGATRWNTRTPFVTSGGLYSQEGQGYQPYGQGRTEMEALKAYFDTPASRFSVNQDSLCNKCHGGVYP
jgi:predicted CXXCH cytochrome family protein